MSSGLEHQECGEALGAYALGGLSPDEATRVRVHLEGCHACRAELDWLRAAVDTLPASVPQVEPPPELKSRVMEIVEAEAQLLRAAGEAADHPPARRTTSGSWRETWRRRFGSWLSPAVGLAAVCAAAIVAVVLATSGAGGTRTITAQITSRQLAARVHATVRVTGTRAELEVAGLPAPPADHVDELWVKPPGGAPEPAGTFVVQSGTVRLTRPVHHGDTVMATVEPGRGGAAPTTAPFMVAPI